MEQNGRLIVFVQYQCWSTTSRGRVDCEEMAVKIGLVQRRRNGPTGLDL